MRSRDEIVRAATLALADSKGLFNIPGCQCETCRHHRDISLVVAHALLWVLHHPGATKFAEVLERIEASVAKTGVKVETYMYMPQPEPLVKGGNG